MSAAKYQMFGLVRDKATGKPRVDNPAELHPMQVGMMKLAEREELGIWAGHFARDAEGIKTLAGDLEVGLKPVDNLVAVSEIFIIPDDGSGAKLFSVHPRCDVLSGDKVPPNNIKPAT